MLGKLRPGGIVLASIRDYDRLIVERPAVQGPAMLRDEGRRRLVFQVWDWIDERRYTFHMYITRETDSGWETWYSASVYRAVLCEELSDLFLKAGFTDTRCWAPAESGFYQPLLMARRPDLLR